MLEKIRSSAQSFGVKVAFGVIILVFVFWGVGNFNDRDYSNVVAVVNGEPIVATEFERAYQNAEEYILRNNPGMTREKLAQEHLGRQVLNDMIRGLLLEQEARRAGMAITALELRQAVGQMKAFQNEAGKFDPEAYKRALEARRMSPAQYEKQLAGDMLRQKVFDMVTSGAWVDPEEAKNRYDFLRQRRVIDYIFIPAKDFLAKAAVSEADIKAWHEAHHAEFAIPARVDVEYLLVRPEKLVDPSKFGEEALKLWYDANKARFAEAEAVKLAHILLPLAEDADEESLRGARAKMADAKGDLAAGKTFAEVAHALNPENAAGPDGELGWVERGQTVPAFEKAAFEGRKGELVEARTPFGLHLINIEDKRPAGVKPFEQVREEVRKALAFEEGSERMHEVLDNLIEANILNKPMAESAASYNLETARTGLQDKTALMEKLGVGPEGADALLAVEAGLPLDTALEAGGNYIIARIVEASPAGEKSFGEVREQIAERLKLEEAEKLALRAAGELLDRIRSQPLAEVRKSEKDLKTGITIERGAPVPGFASNPALGAAIFEGRAGEWLPEPRPAANEAGEGAILARVDRVLQPEPGEFEGVAEILDRAAREERREALFNLFIQTLADRAKIEVTNQNLIDRVNM